MLELGYGYVGDNGSLSFFIDNRANSGILMKPQGFSLTSEILERSIAEYTRDRGVPPTSLDGTIIRKNLENFQKEFDAIRQRQQEPDDDSAYQEAIRKISFGRERENLGYSEFDINVSKHGYATVDGITLKDVPVSVSITAKKPQD